VKNLLVSQFGVSRDELNTLRFYLGGKGRIYVYKDCNLDVREKRKGIYFGTLERNGLRLSIEGSFIIGKIAGKGILNVDDKAAMKWLRGEDIEAGVEGYWIVKWGEYFLGCGFGDGRILRNYVPKERRITEQK
jgi:NOL1/NOP2/fmu family ribosome biogenesis protein